MKISDILKYKWINKEEWFERWYNHKLCFLAFSKVNPLIRLFNSQGLKALSLNTYWFYEEKDSQRWDSGKVQLARDASGIAQLVSQTEKYLKDADDDIKKIIQVHKITPRVLEESKGIFLKLWFVFVIDLGKPLALVLDEELSKKGLSSEQVEQVKDYCFNFQDSFGFQEEEVKLRRIKIIYEKLFPNKKIPFRDLPESINKLLYLHQKNYYFLSGQDLDTIPYTAEDFYRKMLNLPPERVKKKRKLSKKISKLLNKKDKWFLELIHRHIFLDNYTADLYAKLDSFLLNSLSQEFGVSFRDLTWYSWQELEHLVMEGTKVEEESLKSRKKFRVLIQIDGQIKIFYGKYTFKQIEDSITRNIPQLANVKFILGMSASRGLAKGRVKIVNKTEDMVKINKGDILCSVTTRPDLLPAIYRSGAIITDAGGVTSHAAIISRELRIPCIVGTKIATQVLKDGDLVEVDAEEGIVRILS